MAPRRRHLLVLINYVEGVLPLPRRGRRSFIPRTARHCENSWAARSRGSFAAWCVAPSSPEEEKPDNAKVAAERNCKNFLISMPRQPARLELIVIFEKAIRLETGFWKWAALRIMGLNSWSVRLAQQSGT